MNAAHAGTYQSSAAASDVSGFDKDFQLLVRRYKMRAAFLLAKPVKGCPR